MTASPREAVWYAALLGPYWLDTPALRPVTAVWPVPRAASDCRAGGGRRTVMVVVAAATVAAALLVATLG